MEDQTQRDIRSLLKSFGIQADEEIANYLAAMPGFSGSLTLRITLEDITDYGDEGPAQPLILEIEGLIRR